MEPSDNILEFEPQSDLSSYDECSVDLSGSPKNWDRRANSSASDLGVAQS